MRIGLTWVMAAVAAVLAGPTCLAQTNTPEVEPNENKGTATPVADYAIAVRPDQAPGLFAGNAEFLLRRRD